MYITCTYVSARMDSDDDESEGDCRLEVGTERLNRGLIDRFCSQVSNWRVVSLLKRPHTSLINHAAMGMSEPQYIPLMSFMLWRILETQDVGFDWRVMFYLKSVIDITNDMPAEALRPLRSAMSSRIERMILVFSVVFEDVGHVMCVLIVRPDSGCSFITVLDNIWNGADGGVDYRSHYLKMITQIAQCVDIFRVALPPDFKPDDLGCVERLSDADQPPWLKDVLKTKLHTGNVASDALQCAYDAYLFIQMAVCDAAFVGDEMREELSRIHAIIDGVNSHLTESISSGSFQLSVVSIYIALLRSDRVGVSSYYVIDPFGDRPSDVFGLAVSADGGVSALRYGKTDAALFRWEPVLFPGTDAVCALGRRKRDCSEFPLDRLLLLFKQNNIGGIQSLESIYNVLERMSSLFTKAAARGISSFQ